MDDPKGCKWTVLKVNGRVPMYARGSIVYEKNRNNFDLGYEMGRKGQKCQKFLLLDRLLKVTESILQYLLHVEISDFFEKFIFFLYSRDFPDF